MLALAVVPAAQAQDPVTEITSLSGPSTPAEPGTHTVTVSGHSVGDNGLVVVGLSSETTCPATAPADNRLLTTNVPDGPFSRSTQYTAGGFRAFHVLCAYLGGGPPVTRSFQTRDVNVSMAISLSPSAPLDGADTSVIVSGYVEINIATPIELVLRETSGPCLADPLSEKSAPGALVINPERFFTGTSRSFAFPIIAPDGRWRVCGYARERLWASSPSIDGGSPAVTNLAVHPGSSDMVEDAVSTIVATGFIETSGGAQLLLQTGGTSCRTTAAEQRDQPSTIDLGTERVSRTFSRVFSAVPITDGPHIACLYLGTQRAQTAFNVRPPTGQLVLDVPGSPVIGQTAPIITRGSVEAPRTLEVHLGPPRACGATIDADRDQAQVVALGDTSTVGPGAIDGWRPYVPTSTAEVQLCAYVADRSDEAPLAIAAALMRPVPAPAPGVTPPGGTPPGTTPPGVLPGGPTPGAGGPLDIDPGPIPDEVGQRSQGRFWVNNTVMPPGITAARFVALAKRSGERWGYKFMGTTSKGAAKRDGLRVIGFSSAVTPSQVGRLVTFRKRAARPRGCGTSRTGRCRTRYVTVEREIALSRKLATFWDGADHPPADRYDVESVLLRLFGTLAGNVAQDPACAGTPLLRSTGVTPGWWWRSPDDWFRPRCPNRSA